MSALILTCLIVAIADGDSMTARCGEPGAYEQMAIRVSAIDAPEKKQAFGQRAKEQLSELCFNKTALIRVVTADRYGRSVADVECSGIDVGRHMIGGGYAWVYTKYAAKYPDLAPLERRARERRTGLWADSGTSAAPIPPWAWRKGCRDVSICGE